MNQVRKPAPASVIPEGHIRLACDKSIWLTDLTYTQQAVSADLVPQAIGGIATFTERYIDCVDPIRIIKYPETLAELLDKHGCPDIIGFSNYIWNHALSCAFATRIKEVSPQTIVVFGGPNYPVVRDEQNEFLKQHPFVDFYIIKEGELAFARLVESLVAHDMNKDEVHGTIGSVHSQNANGTLHLPEHLERIRDLSEIPSPYTAGRLDEFFDGKLMPIIQTNRGCPFSCTFCVEGTQYYSKIYKNSQQKVADEISYIARKMSAARSAGGRNDLFIADSNFGMYKDDIDTCKEIAKAQEECGWPEYINVATGKNQKERVLEAARLINGALRLSGSVQSLDPEVLENIKRKNIAADDLMKLALEAADVGANSYSETILCLPGDSKERHFETLRRVVEAGFNNVSTFQLMILPGSEMGTKESIAQYGMDIRYRIFPRCYGNYDVLGKTLPSAEIEEVCVALKTLTFEDYLDCRRMHLLIAIFYNDGAFTSLLKLLRSAKISIFRWLELLHSSTPPAGLAAIFDRFLDDTRNELWNDKEALDEFISSPENIERYVNGEIGNNLLFTYKTRAYLEHPQELAEFAKATVLKILNKEGLSDPDTTEFVENAATFQAYRMMNIFDHQDEAPEGRFNFDIAGYETSDQAEPISAFRLDEPQSVRFMLSTEQRDLIDRYLGVFGNTPWGIGRMMTKVYVKRLLRSPDTSPVLSSPVIPGTLIDDKADAPLAGGLSEG